MLHLPQCLSASAAAANIGPDAAANIGPGPGPVLQL